LTCFCFIWLHLHFTILHALNWFSVSCCNPCHWRIQGVGQSDHGPNCKWGPCNAFARPYPGLHLCKNIRYIYTVKYVPRCKIGVCSADMSSASPGRSAEANSWTPVGRGPPDHMVQLPAIAPGYASVLCLAFFPVIGFQNMC